MNCRHHEGMYGVTCRSIAVDSVGVNGLSPLELCSRHSKDLQQKARVGGHDITVEKIK